MDDMWMKIGSALLLGMMIIFLWPNAKRMIKESPKGSSEEWKSAIIPITLVIGLVVLMMMAI